MNEIHKQNESRNLEPSDSTAALLDRARAGEAEAIDRLLRRYLPQLRQWARGRLPAGVRGAEDTDDLVQRTMLRALGRLDHFEPRHPGAFFAYLRAILRNLVVDETRKAVRRPGAVELDDAIVDPCPTPLARAVGRDALERFDNALSGLPVDYQAAVTLRLELGLSYDEIGEIMGGRTGNAARLLVVRAVARLAEGMQVRAPSED